MDTTGNHRSVILGAGRCRSLGSGGHEFWFFATAYHAPPGALWTQLCFSKSSCATRLKVSAATVLSRRGAVIPHVQWEQHQPLKSSPSIQIRCLFIHLPLRGCWD